MARVLKRGRTIVALCASVFVVLFVVGCNWTLFAARFGSPAMRQVILSDWADQSDKLSRLQKKVLLALLYTEVGDPSASGQALAVLRSHLKEDEDDIIRHLVYVAFTSKKSSDRIIALFGLKSVSPRHKDIAATTLLYHLTYSNSFTRTDNMQLVAAASGLGNLSVREALPNIEQLTNHPNKLVAGAAERAIARLRAPE